MSIGKLQAALAQATSEVTVAAANINFDFCLVKYEAPEEYRPIGELLSASRKKDAEGGSSHVTARRLAALFEGICPDTPNLIKAYGKRASEISKKVHGQELKDYSTSMFGSYAGIDATSIWAAATSTLGKMNGAIHVHLLACVLALMFDAAEAISIWVELVEERRKAVAKSWEQDEDIPFSTAAAAVQQGITRSQVAEWDSSARAWLQTADTVMLNKQTQLRLILRNVNLTLGPETTVYTSVVDTWRKTLRTMERLVSGIPQEVQDGSAILGLAAWHIYPDIHVFGGRNVEVEMGDPLVAPGGILSLGCSPSATTPISGVSWSLSLAQFKYYGQPVKRRGVFKPDPNLITFKNLLLITLGCLLSRWGVSMDRGETTRAIKIISLLSRNSTQSGTQEKGNTSKLSAGFNPTVEGLQLLSEAAREHSSDEETALRFINLGRNRTQFLPPRTYMSSQGSQAFLQPFLGLDQVNTLLQSIRSPDGRVEFLRRMATKAKELIGHNCIIQYSDQVHRDDDMFFNYATVFSRNPVGAENSESSPAKKNLTSHARWVYSNMSDTGHLKETLYQNENYSVYCPSSTPRITCTHKPRPSEQSILRLWYGKPEVAAIYVLWDEELPPAHSPKITIEDLLWCLEHDLLSPELCLLQANDSVTQTLKCFAAVNNYAFRTITEPVIQIQTLEKPLIDADCMTELLSHQHPLQPLSGHSRAISILSYLVAGHDILHSKIPKNVIGMSIGNSIFVPQQLLCDPLDIVDRKAFTRILGNIGKPGFVMFFSVESPEVAPPDNVFWRDNDPHEFDGAAVDLFSNTSMHLSFTNWERPLEGFSYRGNQDVQMILMESVISIRERGKWVGDVDLIPALKSPVIYQLPPQQPCEHLKPEPPEVYMISIESWDELRNFHAGNVVVRASGNWLARLGATAYLAQYAQRSQCGIRRITLCPPSVCWKCLNDYIKQFSANIYIY